MRVPVSLVFLTLIFGEIAGFILVGQAIGVLPTLALILLGMVAGVFLLRTQGIATLMRAKAEAEAGRTPARPLAEGAITAVAALMIMLPGFLSDLAGLLLLLPFVRNAVMRALGGRIHARTVSTAATARRSSTVIELDEGDYDVRPRPDSPWRLNKGSGA